jgi:hypothetical protein
MLSATAVLVCALSLLGRDARSMPPIELLERLPPGVSPRVEAFVYTGGRTIYLATSSPVFQEARRADRSTCGGDALKKLASILVHEEWHVRHGRDERGAYEAQIDTLRRLNIQPDSRLLLGVTRSMLAVLEAQRYQQPELVVAARRSAD